jgi:hypothetical protein
MVKNENLISLVNNKKPIELVKELKDEYQVPSFEEFMKDYKSDGNLNYDDLKGGGDIGTRKGYGPCEHYKCCQPSNCHFRLEINISSEGVFSDFRRSYFLNDAMEGKNFFYTINSRE